MHASTGAAAPINVPKDALIEIRGAPYKLVPHSVPGRILLLHGVTGQPYQQADDSGEVGLLTEKGREDLMLSGDYLVRESLSAMAARRRASEWTVDEIEELDTGARKMLVQCDLLDEAGVPNGTTAIAKGLAELWTPELREKFGEYDNPHTIKRWRRERGRPGARAMKDMVRLWGRTTGLPFWNDVRHESAWKAALLKSASEGMSFRDAEAEHAAEIQAINAGLSPHYDKPPEPLEPYGYHTIRRYCIQLESAATVETAEGTAVKEARWRGAGKPLTADRALELSIIDHTPLDVMVMDPDREIVLGRPWLTLNVDVHSRAILGHVITFRAPSLWTMGETIRRSNLPKRPPAQFVKRYPILTRIMGKSEIFIDNALDHRGHGLEDAAKGAGFGVRFGAVKQPRARAIVERALGTVQRLITPLLPGATKAIAWARVAEYDAEATAWCTIDEIEAIANYAIAEYHTTPGPDGRPPALKFEKSVNKHGIDLVHDIAGFQRELLEVRLGVQLSKSGVRVFGLRYHSAVEVPKLLDDLIPLEPRRQRRDDATVTGKIKFDPGDIRQIYFWNRARRIWVPLACAEETYAAGMPLWFHEAIQDAARLEGAAFNTEDERLGARARRVQAIRNIAPEAKKRQRDLLGQLYEIPRIRQITGNLVHVHTDQAQPVGLEDFVAHDLASKTSLDDEILAPRRPQLEKGTRRRGGRATPDRDRRDAGWTREDSAKAEPVRVKRRVTGRFS